MCKVEISFCFRLICIPLALCALRLDAQEGQATLNVDTLGGQSVFHVGELIPLKLRFQSPNDTGYLIAPMIDGREGEFDCNQFEVTGPTTGWSDPLKMYYQQDLIRTGHGWPWHPLEKAKPVDATLYLNEWIRFDEPGKYTVKVSSYCVCKIGSTKRHPLSKTIQLEIVPATKEWQDETFKRILAKSHLPDRPTSYNAVEPGQSLAVSHGPILGAAREELKYLATSAAIEEMTYGLRSEKYNMADQCSIGLEGLPPVMRETAIAFMNKRIEEPDFPITSWFFSTLSFLHVKPGSEKESIREQRESANSLIWSAIYSAVIKKTPEARAETVQTLLSYGHNITSSEVKQQMASLLKLSFLDLDMRNQIDDLRREWDRLRSPEFLPVLQGLARTPVRGDADMEVSVYDRQELKGLALKRWYELDPEGAHREILDQIGSSHPTLIAHSIAFLPEEQLPQFELLWANAFLQTTSQNSERALGSLLLRFGAGAATQQMIAKLDEVSDYPCDAHVVALAYLARFDPDVAKRKLQLEFPGKCSGRLLESISELAATAAVLNDQAVANLNSSDPEVARDAVLYLTSYSKKEDEAPLWRRYEKWTSAYKGKVNLLDREADTWYKTFANSQFGEELGGALISGQGWFADAELVSRVVQRCVGKRMCEQLKQDAEGAEAPYQLDLPNFSTSLGGLTDESVGIAQYNARTLRLFEEKVAQFPSGTTFFLNHWYRATNTDQEVIEAKVRTILQRHGMYLEIAKK